MLIFIIICRVYSVGIIASILGLDDFAGKNMVGQNLKEILSQKV